jgi:hypothetical protein
MGIPARRTRKAESLDEKIIPTRWRDDQGRWLYVIEDRKMRAVNHLRPQTQRRSR